MNTLTHLHRYNDFSWYLKIRTCHVNHLFQCCYVSHSRLTRKWLSTNENSVSHFDNQTNWKSANQIVRNLFDFVWTNREPPELLNVNSCFWIVSKQKILEVGLKLSWVLPNDCWSIITFISDKLICFVMSWMKTYFFVISD